MTKKESKKKVKEQKCLCPYCEEELIVAASPLCQACGIVFYQCRKCQVTVLDRKAKNCPKCGEPLT